jgi:hypothetical protein
VRTAVPEEFSHFYLTVGTDLLTYTKFDVVFAGLKAGFAGAGN